MRSALGPASELIPLGDLSAMWCATCQQDVSSPANAGAEPARCGKCGHEVAKCEQPGPRAPNASPTRGEGRTKAPSTKPRLADDWELEADLRGVERLLGTLKASGLPRRSDVAAAAIHNSPVESLSTRLHAAHAEATGWHAAAARPKSHSLAWGVLAISLATFACGAVLLGWSFVADRADLWPIGLPLALIGQAGLIIGLVLQLDGLWQSNRQTAETLSELDGELSRVRHATTLLTTTKNASAQSFYAHMAEGASPQLLLADLKGQLDLLAQQMASQQKR